MKKEKIEPMDWEEIIMNVGNPVYDKFRKIWRVLDGYKRVREEYYVLFSDSGVWQNIKSVKLYSKKV